VTDGNKWPKNAIFRLAQMAPPIECDLDYRFRTRTLNPNPKSNKNLCSAKRHPNKVQDSVIIISYFPWVGGGYTKGLYRKVVANDDHIS